MTEMEHTTGPWEWQSPYDPEEYPSEKGRHYIVGSNLGGLVGAALPWPSELDNQIFDRVEANARLMASAPEMLEALKSAIDLSDRTVTRAGRTDECQAVYDKVKSAIAKAEGRT